MSEDFFEAVLRRFSVARQRMVLEPVMILTGRLLENNPAFHYLIVLAATFVVIAVYAEIRQLTLFSLHPVCMSIGVLVFLAEGIVAYR